MTYSTGPMGEIIRDADGAVIPQDISVTSYQDYLYWQQYGIYLGPVANDVLVEEVQVEVITYPENV
jgi:hypothetical protein